MAAGPATVPPASRPPLAPCTRTVAVGGRPTAIRLEPAFWAHLEEIGAREGLTLDELCTGADRRRGAGPLGAALRALVVAYFRAATPAGEAPAGHGPSAALRGALERIA